MSGTKLSPGQAPEGPLAIVRDGVRRIEHDLVVTAGRTTRCHVTGPDENGGYQAGNGLMALFTPGAGRGSLRHRPG